jgi:hypothetical protein
MEVYMGKVRSARGEMVDFDLLRIKETILQAEETVEVQGRQDFIDHRLRRKTKKVEPPAPAVEMPIESENGLPGVDDVEDELIEDELIEETPPKKTRKTKQKARD